MNSFRFAAAIVVLSGLAVSAFGQCTQHVTVNLFDAFVATGNPHIAGGAPAGSAFKFYSGNPGGTPLIGVQVGSFTGYGRPETSYTIPLVGPIFSTDSAINQIGFHDSAIRHNGLMCHPGNTGNEDCIVCFEPQMQVTLYGMTADVDVLGDVSDGVAVSFGDVTNAATHSGPTTQVFYGAASVTHVDAGLAAPLTLNPGDKVFFRVDMRGNPFEDWANTNVFCEFTGGPVVIAPPKLVNGCINQTAQLTITAAGSGTISYQWRRHGVPLTNGPHYGGVTTNQMSIFGIRPEDVDSYDCVVSSTCGTLTSTSVQVEVCAANFNCDGAVDFFDYLDFVDAFAAMGAGSDFNADGVVDFFDYLDFVDAFSLGC